MNSSGIKRGLAVSAISALAIAGIPQLAAPASAITHNDVAGAGNVVLLNADNTPLSIVNDGTDTTVRLEAAAGADFTSLTFQYALSPLGGVQGSFVDITTVQRNDDGAFSFEWTPPAGIIGQRITLRATGTSTAAGNAVDSDDATNVTVSNTAASVNLANGSALGVFDTPYSGPVAGDLGFGQNVRLAGTSSSNAAVTLGAANAPGTNTVTPTTAAGATTATFEGYLDITGYDFAGTDELAANATNASQDFEGYTLYNQVITTVTATPSATNVPVGGPTPTVTIKVVDQNGAPIVGAEVRNNAGTLVGYTNAAGVVTTTQAPGTTASYYANATDTDGFNAVEGDKSSGDVVITQFAPVITSLVATSRDGAAFDIDENTAADIVVQAKDQTGGNTDVPDAQDLSYYWVITPFDGSPATVRYPVAGQPNATVANDTNGAFSVPLPTAAQGAESGTYELFAGLTDVPGTPADESFPVASRLVVKVGQAALTFDGTGPQSAPAAGSTTVSGKLALEDGTALAGRTVRLTYTRGPAGTAVGADATPDSGFADGSDNGTDPDLTVDVVTGANGGFSATVVDPAETGAGATQGSELGGTVTATTVAGTVANNPDQDNPNAAAATRVVNFVSTVAPPNSTVVITEIATAPRPGEVVSGTATVTVPDGPDNGTDRDVVAGQQVTLTLPAGSGAYFTDGTAAPAPVVGADAGTFRDLGKSITVTSGTNGVVSFQLAIGRDAGFDDDGLAEAIVTATIGTATGQSDTEDVDFTSANPLNGGRVELVLSPEGEQEDDTTPARPGQEVFFDIFTYDQFGNRVGGEPVTITAVGDDDDTVTDIDLVGASVSDFDENGDFSVTATSADTVTVTGTWVEDNFVYTSTANNGAPASNGSDTFTDTAEVTFADVVVDPPAQPTLTGNPESRAVVNTAVTETFTLKDTAGNPIAGATVVFDRSGAGGSATVTRTTNAQGVATYVFTSAEQGLTTITAEATGLNVSASDTVNFVAAPPVLLKVQASTGQANNGRTDIFRILSAADNQGDVANGARVTLFKKVNGRNVRVQTAVKTLNRLGQATFRIADLNKKQLTLYFVKVSKTSDTPAGQSPVKKVR